MIKGFLVFDFFHFDNAVNANRSILLFCANIQNNARINANYYILLHENMCALSFEPVPGHNDMIQDCHIQQNPTFFDFLCDLLICFTGLDIP
jgi:hypothetical protein